MYQTLFTGGVKSGKSRQAERYCIEHFSAISTPIYLATTEYIDSEMQQRISEHQQRRKNTFLTLEEPIHLANVIQSRSEPVLIECMTMWLNNMLFHHYTTAQIFEELERLVSLSNPVVYVLNEVGLGIIPDNELAREFVDLSGRVSQFLGNHCQEVYFCVAGQVLTMKGKQ